MSGMSGLELLPKAKAVRPDVPIIMITAYGDPETKRQAFENGAEALLTKPIDSRRCAVRSTAASGAPHSRLKFPEFVALRESLDGRYCCKSRKSISPKNLAKVDFWTSLPLRRFSAPLGRSVVDFG
jgi:DNA-binding response OmpR family regulator